MYRLVFKPSAVKDLEKLNERDRIRIINKLEFFVLNPNSLHFAEKLTHPRLGSYRFRIGTFRAVFDLNGQTLVVLLIGHRREIYR